MQSLLYILVGVILSNLLLLLLFVEFQVLDNFTSVKLAILRWDMRHQQEHREEFQDSHGGRPKTLLYISNI